MQVGDGKQGINKCDDTQHNTLYTNTGLALHNTNMLIFGKE